MRFFAHLGRLGNRPRTGVQHTAFLGEGRTYRIQLTVCVEHDGQTEIIVAKKTFRIGTELQNFKFETDKIIKEGRYRLAFYLGDNPVGDQIWLDKIQLNALN